MDKITQTHLHNLWSGNRNLQNKAYYHILDVTDRPVDWAYSVWDEMIANLGHKDNHNRSIAAQVLCNLSRSDPQSRMIKDFDTVLAVTRDERFVTARHTLQAIWKIGTAGRKQLKMVLEGLASRYKECANEKNCALIRYDIIVDLRKLYDEVRDERVKTLALELIESERDSKYRQKYAGPWKGK